MNEYLNDIKECVDYYRYEKLIIVEKFNKIKQIETMKSQK